MGVIRLFAMLSKFEPWGRAIRWGVAPAMLALGAHAVAQSDPAEEPAVVAVEKVMPAVVNISTERIVRREVRDPMDDFFDQFFGGPMRPPRETRRTVQSLGSGFFIDGEGSILTNEHVVERAEDLRIQVTANDGRVFDAHYVSGDASSDLALIKIDGEKGLPFIDLENLSENRLGQTALVLGNPLGYGSSVSRGILSALNRTIQIDGAEYRRLLQTDAAINPGNSGGPMVDLKGRLMGVSSVKMAFTPTGVPVQGMGFAIPAEVVRERVADMRRAGKGEAAPGRDPIFVGQPAALRAFGMQLQEMTAELAEAFKYSGDRGVLITDVERGSPADTAGLRKGLVILRVGRYEINGVADLERVLAGVEPGSRADFMVATQRRIGRRIVQQVETVTLVAR
jgi:serine protease Do